MVLTALVKWIHTNLLKAFFKGKLSNEITNRAHIVSYTKLKICNHRLAVERGRYYKIPRKERHATKDCEFCKTHQTFQAEDEMHILLSCLKHEASRKDLFDVIKSKYHNFDKLQKEELFNYLLNFDGPIVRAVARFYHLVQNS